MCDKDSNINSGTYHMGYVIQTVLKSISVLMMCTEFLFLQFGFVLFL